MYKKPWNKGLTKETSLKVNQISKKKSLYWKKLRKNNPEKYKQVCKKIGKSSKGRIKGMELHPSWKGGRYKDSRDGYIFIRKLNYPSARSDGYVLEHRFVMEKYLGRQLNPNEEIHHKNGIKDDNRIENLKLVVKKSHFGKTKCPYCQKEFEIK